MKTALQILALLLVLVPEGRAQTFATGDYQINRKKSTAGFEVAELLAGSNITLTWNDATKTASLTSPLSSTGGTTITTLGTITVGTWTATPITDAYIASAATWNAKQAALVSGTNIKTVNNNSLLGSGNLTTAQLGALADGDTLTTGLTFPPSGLLLQNEDDTTYKLNIQAQDGTQTATRILYINTQNADRSIDLSGDLTVSSAATISGTNTGDQTTITGNSGTTTAALGLKTATSTVGISTATAPSSGQVLTATSGTAATWQTPAATGIGGTVGTTDNRIPRADGTGGSTLQSSNVSISDGGFVESLGASAGFSSTLATGTPSTFLGSSITPGGLYLLYTDSASSTLVGQIEAPSVWPDSTDFEWELPAASGTVALLSNITGTNSGTNTGDVTLAGAPDYITISGQTITRNAIDLAADVTGTLPIASGGTSSTTLTANAVLLGNGTSALQTVAPGTTGNVLTSNGTTWTSAAATGATYATELQARQGTSTTTAVAPATLWSALHESLFIADFSRFVSTTSTGSGSVTTTGSTPGPTTGSTANSTARGQWITQAKSGSSTWGTMDFSRPSAFGLTLFAGNSSGAISTGIYRVWIGTDTNATSIAARGFGFEIRHHRIWIIAHNGTTLVTQDTGADISSTAFVLNVLRCVNDGAGNISVFFNNAQIGTALAGGPTTAGNGTLNILNLNGATAAANDIRTLAGTFKANVY